MEANKKKEEILKKHVFKLSNLGGFEIEVLEAMDEYANQLLLENERENERLKSLLDDTSVLVNNFRFDLEIEKKKVLLNYESAVSFEKQVKQLQSELSELKEKRKEEVIKFSEFLKDYEYITPPGFKCGAYVNKNEVDIYVNGSDQHYKNLVLNHGKSIEQLCELWRTQTYGQ